MKPSGWSSANRPLAIGGPGGRAAALGNRPAEGTSCRGHNMTTIDSGWDVGTIVTLILGITATIGLIMALMWTWSRG